MIHSMKVEFGEKWFRSMFEKLPAGVYICDAEGRIKYFNQRAVEVWGRRPELDSDAERFCGSFKLYFADGAPMSHDQCWMALAIENNEEYFGREVVIERPDGSRLTGLAHVSPIRDGAGILLGAVNVVLDITDRKQAEQALNESERSLREMIEELARFNRVAVGREMRMIELKKEVNELCRRLGETPRYPLEFERDEKGREAYV
jgi:two-component system, LuxR family, sensor kinase FixL